MATGGARNRGRGGPGRLAWVSLGGAMLVILGLTFALGMLVGRQWARQMPPAAAAAATGKSTAARRSGLSEMGAQRAVEPQEKLTFYRTLTAPLGERPLPARAEVAPKPQPGARPRVNPAARPPAQEPVPTRGDEPTLPSRAAAGAEGQAGLKLTPLEAKASEERQAASSETPFEPKGGRRAAGEERHEASPGMSFEPRGGRQAAGEERHEASPGWTVQVGVFKSPQQAERTRRALADGGFPAEVTPVTAADGQVRYRVRVGAFKTKEEALRTGERVRSDQSLPTFVTEK